MAGRSSHTEVVLAKARTCRSRQPQEQQKQGQPALDGAQLAPLVSSEVTEELGDVKEERRFRKTTGRRRKVDKKRRVLTIAKKMDIIKRLEEGSRPKNVAAALKLPPSTISTVWKCKDKVKASAATITDTSQLRLVRNRDNRLERMEEMLCTWILDRNQKNWRITQALIQEKAMSLWGAIKRGAADDQADGPSTSSGAAPRQYDDFKASRGWFMRFQVILTCVMYTVPINHWSHKKRCIHYDI